MKKLMMVAIIGISTFLVGCGDGLTDREESCLEATGNIQCKSKAELELELARIQGNTDVQVAKAQGASLPSSDIPVPPGDYTNYYGNEKYGSWQPDGSFQFNDPTSSWATETNMFLLGAGLGGLAGYMATKSASRSEWKKTYPTGYIPQTRKVQTYSDKKGNPISRNEYQKRLAQSNKDRMKDQRRKKVEAIKAKQQKTVYQPSPQPVVQKPGQPPKAKKPNKMFRSKPVTSSYTAPKVSYSKKRK